ncbi:MAG TPA: formyltransferase family protein, partial [Thermomicrobiales bacterium]|nr:formyltransferase family protein [Thermomicrobiales bacterium]
IRPLGHRIVGVVTSPGPRNRRTTDYVDVVSSVPPGIDTIVTSHPKRIAAMIAPLQPDLIISAGFRWMLPEDAIALPRIGAINLHPSLLPRHRGPHPLEWTFRSGDTEAGFTVHKLAAGFDTGPVLSQARVPVDDDDDVEALVERMFPIVPSLIVEALQGLAHGESGIAQVQDDATHAGPFEDEWRTIDWSRSAREIHNQIRSWSGNRGIEAGAFADIDGSRYTIHRTRLIAGRDHDVMPVGARLNLGVEGVFVQCGDGPIEIIASDPPIPPGHNRVVDPSALSAIRMRQFAIQGT